MADTVAIDDLQGGVRLITLNRPEKKNALTGAMYEIVPGFLANLLVAVVVSRITPRHDPQIQAEFSAMERQVRADRRGAAEEATV